MQHEETIKIQNGEDPGRFALGWLGRWLAAEWASTHLNHEKSNNLETWFLPEFISRHWHHSSIFYVAVISDWYSFSASCNGFQSKAVSCKSGNTYFLQSWSSSHFNVQALKFLHWVFYSFFLILICWLWKHSEAFIVVILNNIIYLKSWSVTCCRVWNDSSCLGLCICGELSSNPTVFLPHNEATDSLSTWLIPFSPFRWGGWLVASPGYLHCILQMVLDADWALWASLCFSLWLVLSGLLHPENTVHMERVAGSLEAACSCSVCWCTWTRKPFAIVWCVSGVHLGTGSGREQWC